MLVSHGSQYAHRIVADTRQDDPLVRDAQPHQVVMKVAVTLKGLVSVPDDQAQTRTTGKGGSVLLRITARADREEARLLAAINVSKEALAWTLLARGVLSSVSCIGPAPIIETF
jgi:hypothetical protein